MAKKNNISKVVMPILLLGGAGFVAYKAMELGNSVANLSFDFKDVKYKGIKSFNLNLDVRFNVVNPSGSKFTIEFISLDLILPNGKVVGQIRQPNFNKEITQKGITTVTLKSSSNLLSAGLGIANQILNIFTGTLPDITVKGNIRANGVLLTLDETVKLSDDGLSGTNKLPVRLYAEYNNN